MHVLSAAYSEEEPPQHNEKNRGKKKGDFQLKLQAERQTVPWKMVKLLYSY
jgi:hypothetical protein